MNSVTNWKHVCRFISKEFEDPDHPGSGECIDARIVLLLDKLALTTDFRVMTNWRIGGCVDMHGSYGHSQNSYHLYRQGCKAVDFHLLDHEFKPLKINLREQFNYVCRAGFPCVIIYPWWNNPGFHVDCRPMSRTNHLYSPKKGVYIPLFP